MSKPNEPMACLGALLRLFVPTPSPLRTPAGELDWLPYRLRDDFLSPAELSFYRVATFVLGSRALLCPKVRLADLFYVSQPQLNQRYFAGIAQKHVDFVLTNPARMLPIAGVELDDASHQRDERVRCDIIVDRVFAAAGLPLVRVPAKVGYARPEIERLLGSLLSGPAPLPPNEAETSTQFVIDHLPPRCPKCNEPMVIQTARKGA